MIRKKFFVPAFLILASISVTSVVFTNCSGTSAFKDDLDLGQLSEEATDDPSKRPPYLPIVTMGGQEEQEEEQETSSSGSNSNSSSGTAPVITEQPKPQYATRNTWVELRVSAEGPPFPNVQWYRNSEPVPGATSGTLRLRIDDNTIGFYAAIVYFDSGPSVTSNGVFVAMAPDATAPQILQQPISQSLPTGGSVQLVAGYSGDPYPQIQWLKDGVAIPGQTSNLLTVNSVGYYSFYVWNEAGGVNSNSAEIASVSAAPTVAARYEKGVAFSYATAEGGTERLRVGHVLFAGDGTISGKYFATSQASVSVVSSGISGFSSTGQRCSAIRKPVLTEHSISGSVAITVNTITLHFDGHTVIFNRSNGTKVLSLASVNGVSRNVGFGYVTYSDPALSAPINSDFGGSAYKAAVGQFYHKRGAESWWLMGYEMGAYPQAHRDLVSSGVVANGQYDSFLFHQQPYNGNVVFRHFGTDFNGSSCNNADGHVHFMYGFGEDGSPVGFMGIEGSNSSSGNYVSVFTYLKTSMSH